MSESQSDFFFSLLEHAIVPVRATEFAEVETDLYKANTALPTKTLTDFDKYVTAAYYFTRTITVANLLTPTITNKHNDDFELYVTIDRFYKAYGTLPTKTPTDFEQYVTAA